MPIRSIDELRSWAGPDWKDASNEDIISMYSKVAKLPPTEVAMTLGYDPGTGGIGAKELSSSIDRYQAGLYGVGEAVTGALGAKRASNWLAEQRRANELQADVASARAREMGAVTEWKDVEGIGDFGSYAKNLAIQSAPYAAEALTGGLAARGLMSGTRAALTGAKTIEEAAAAKKALDLGSTVGGVAASYPSAVGDILSNQREQSGKTDLLAAGALAIPYAGLNALGVGTALMRGSAFKNTVNLLDRPGGILGAATRTVATGTGVALKEGISETGQEVLNQAGRMAVDPNATLTDPEALERYKESFIGGATLGGLMGGGLGGWRRSAPTNEVQQAFSQPEVSGTPTANVAPPVTPPITPANHPDPMARLAELEAIGRGTPARTVEGPDGQPLKIPATEGRFFTPEEQQEYKALKAQVANMTPPAVTGGTTDIAQQSQAAAAQNQQAEIAQQQQAKRDDVLGVLASEYSPDTVSIFGQTITGPRIAPFGNRFADVFNTLPPHVQQIAKAIVQANKAFATPEKPSPLVSFSFNATNPRGSAEKAIAALGKTMTKFQIDHVQSLDEAVQILNKLSTTTKGNQLEQLNAIYETITGQDTDGFIAAQTAKAEKGAKDGKLPLQTTTGLGTVPVEGGTGETTATADGTVQPSGVQSVQSGSVPEGSLGLQTGQLSGEGIRTGTSTDANVGNGNAPSQVTAKPAPETNQLLRQIFGDSYAIDEKVPPASIGPATRVAGKAGQVYVQPSQTRQSGLSESVPASMAGERVVKRKRRWNAADSAPIPGTNQYYSSAVEHIHPTKRSEIILGIFVKALEPQTNRGDEFPAIIRAQILKMSLMEQMTSAQISQHFAEQETPLDIPAKSIDTQRRRMGLADDRGVRGIYFDTEKEAGRQLMQDVVKAASEFKTDAFPDGIGPDQLKGFYAAKNSFAAGNEVVELSDEVFEEPVSRTTDVKLQEELYKSTSENEATQSMGQIASAGGSQGNVDSLKQTRKDKKTGKVYKDIGALARIEELTNEADTIRDTLMDMAPKDPRREGLVSRLEAIGDVDKGEIAALFQDYNKAQRLRSAEAEEAGVVKKEEVEATKQELTGEELAASEREDERRKDAEEKAKADQEGESNAVQVESADEGNVRESAGGGKKVGKGNAKPKKSAGKTEVKVEPKQEAKPEEIKTPAEQWSEVSKLAPELPPYDVLRKSEKDRWDDLVHRGQANLAAAVKIIGQGAQPTGTVLANEKPETTGTNGTAEAVTAENEIPAPKPILFSKTSESEPVTQAPKLVENGRTVDLVVNGKVTKTFELVSQGLWDAYKGRPESQENLLQSAAARKVRDEASQALKDSNWVYSEQAPLSRVEQEAIKALASNDTSMMQRIVTNLTIRDSVLRMLSSALSFPGKPYNGFNDLAAASKEDPRAKLTAENILRYAPEYMLKGANIPTEFKFSKAKNTSAQKNTVFDVWETLGNLFGIKQKDSAYKDFIRVSQTAQDAYKAAGKKVPLAQLQNAQAFIDPTDDRVVHLIADNITKGSELAVLLHEVGVHVGLKNKLGANFKILEGQVKAWANAPKNSLERQVYERAMARVAAARLDGAVSADIAAEELVAYAAEEAVLAGVQVTDKSQSRLHAWVRKLHDIVEQALKSFLNVASVPKLTTQDLVNFSFAAAQEHMEGIRSERGAGIGATDFEIAKYYAGPKGSWNNSRIEYDTYGPGRESFYWDPEDTFGPYTGIATRGFYERANSRGFGPRATGSPELMAMVLTSAETREFGEQQGNSQDKVLLTLQAVRDPIINSWSLTVAGPDTDSALYTELYINGQATTTTDNTGNEWSRLEGIPASAIMRVLAEFRRRLTRVKDGQIPNIDFTRVTGSGATKDEGRPGYYSAGVLATRYSKAPTGEQVIKALPKPLQETARRQFTNIKTLAKRGFYASAMTEDVVSMAKKYMPSATKFLDAQYARYATRVEFENRINRILTEYDKLPATLKGEGSGSVNEFIFDSTREKKWGYYPGEHQVGTKLFTIDPDFKKRFESFPPAAQKIIKDVFQHGYEALQLKKQSARDAVNREYESREKAAANDADLLDEIAKEKARALKRIASLQNVQVGDPYAYLGRYGNYVVVAKSPEFKAYEDAASGEESRVKHNFVTGDPQQAKNWLQDHISDPNHYVVEFAETQAEADEIAAQLGATGQYDVQPEDAAEKEAHASYAGGADLMYGLSRLRGMAERGGEDTNPALTKAIGDLYLMVVAESSARQRKNVAGASKNMMRNLATSGRADAHFLASMASNDAISDSLESMRVEAQKNLKEARPLYNELYARNALSMDYKPVSDLVTALTRMTSLWTLSTNPAFYLQQMVQTMVLSQPYMAGRLGYFRTGRALKRAYSDIAPLTKDIGIEGHIDFNQAPSDVRNMLNTLVGMGKIDIGIETDIKARTEERGPFEVAMAKLKGVNTRIESINRAAAAVAAYRGYLERYKNGDTAAATKYAAEVIDNTHGSYTSTSAPRILQGNTASLLGQFKRFQIIQLSMLIKLINNSFRGASKEERAVAFASLKFIVAHMAVLGGALGVPFVSQIAWLASKAFGDPDEPDDYEYKLRRMIGDGPAADLLLRGVPAYFGLGSLGKKLSMENVASPFGPFVEPDLASRSGAEKMLVGMMGPAASMGLKFADALDLISKGNYYKGLEMAMPNGVANVMKAYRFPTQGITMRNGDLVMSPDEVSMIDAGFQLVGLPTSTVTDRQFTQKVVAEFDKFYAERAKDIKASYVESSRASDSAAMAEAREDWQKLQESRVRNGYKRQPMSELFRAPIEARKRERSVVGGVETTKAKRRFVEQVSSVS